MMCRHNEISEFYPADDRRGRQRAAALSDLLEHTLGVLRAGAEQGVVNVPDLIERLKSTTFYLDETLVKSVFAPWLES